MEMPDNISHAATVPNDASMQSQVDKPSLEAHVPILSTSASQGTRFIDGEPSEQGLRKAETLLCSLPWFGLSLLYIVLSVQMPVQVEAMVGEKLKGTILGAMVAGSAALTFVTSPLVGLQSDRLRWKFGKRRPVMLVFTLTLCMGLVGMAVSSPEVHIHAAAKPIASTDGECKIDLGVKRCQYYDVNDTGRSPPPAIVAYPFVSQFRAERGGGYAVVFILSYLAVVASYSAIVVPYNALIADCSPMPQRGVQSGCISGMSLLGNVGGAILTAFFDKIGIYGTYGIVGLILTICVITTTAFLKETPTACQLEKLNKSFRWLLLTRFLFQQGIATVLTFMQYWVSDMVYIPKCLSAEKAVGLLVMPLLLAATISSVVSGLMADKYRKRKAFLIVSSMLMGIATASLGAIQGGSYSFYVSLALVTVIGVGFGSYLAVDFALLLDVLPNPEAKGKDLALWNQALILPQVIATPIGGFTLDMFERVDCSIGLGYIMLFVVTATYFIMSGVFTIKIRSQ